MDHREAGEYWNDTAEVWTTLARMGFDVYRDYFNTPAFFALLPPILICRTLKSCLISCTCACESLPEAGY